MTPRVDTATQVGSLKRASSNIRHINANSVESMEYFVQDVDPEDLLTGRKKRKINARKTIKDNAAVGLNNKQANTR